MRITSGTYKGRVLIAPAGDDIRPTSDRARQAIFNILMHHNFDDMEAGLNDKTILDACCGTGAIGIEALSRGAKAAIFMDQSNLALAATRHNLKNCHLSDRGNVMAVDVTAPPPAPFAADIIFLDPPYGKNILADAIAALSNTGYAHAKTLWVLEAGRKEKIVFDGMVILDQRHYGAAAVYFARLAAAK